VAAVDDHALVEAGKIPRMDLIRIHGFEAVARQVMGLWRAWAPEWLPKERRCRRDSHGPHLVVKDAEVALRGDG
jgi:hypothetical protein